MITARRSAVSEFLVLARDLSAGLAAFHVSPAGDTTVAIGPTGDGGELERRIVLIAEECHNRSEDDEAVIVWESDIPSRVDAGLTTLGNSLRAVGVPVRSGERTFGLIGIADYWLPEPVAELRRVLRSVAADLGDWFAVRPPDADRSAAHELRQFDDDAGEWLGDDGAGIIVERERIIGLAEPEQLEDLPFAGGAGSDTGAVARTGALSAHPPAAPAPAPDRSPLDAGVERDGFMTELVDHLPDGLIVTRADGTIVYVNRTLAEMSQRSVGELLGMDVSTILDPGTTGPSGAFSPRPGSIAFLLDTPLAGRELELSVPTGDPVPVEVRGTFLFSAFAGECYVALVRPAPETPVAQRATVAAEPHPRGTTDRRSAGDGAVGDLATIFESLEEGVVACDKTGTVLVANAAASDLQGLPQALELVGQAFPSTTGLRRSDGTFLPLADHPLARALAGTVVEGELLTLIDDEGERRRVLASARPQMLPSGDGAVLVLRDATAQTEEQTRRVSVALRDPLTGLANRQLLLDYLYRFYDQLKTRGGEIAFVYLDLVDFKKVNDSHGWETGDETLIAVARRISRVARSSDLVARPGGDEFVVLPQVATPNGGSIEMIASRIRAAVSTPYHVRGRALRLEASVGCVTADPRIDDPSALLVRASREMYRRRRDRDAAADASAAAGSFVPAGSVAGPAAAPTGPAAATGMES